MFFRQLGVRDREKPGFNGFLGGGVAEAEDRLSSGGIGRMATDNHRKAGKKGDRSKERQGQ
jgi:hypothetical protein